MRRQRLGVSTTQIILLSFLITILIGAGLLSLPISSATGEAIPFLDALFTATTSTCVTGLVVMPTVTSWSVFGQVVILILIQIGGLGVITIMSGLMILLHKKMGIGDRLLLQDAFNLNSLSGLIRFVKKVVSGTLLIEGIGALLYMTVFIPQFGAKGIWISVFTSISAFCNAGIDIIAENSLCDYALNPMINIVTCALIVLGGIGYIVWWDVLRVLKKARTKKVKLFRDLTLHSKIAITATLILILVGAVLIFTFEYNNPQTIKDYSLLQKMEASLFQSVTTRTAGFATIPQQNLTNASSIVCLLLMFIGGSPVGTAGGIKTVTFAVLAASAFASVRNKEDTEVFGRRLTKQAVSKAVAVACMSFIILFASTVLLSAVTDASALDVIYETVSATATVGLTRNLTASLDSVGKLIIIMTMYLGRVGPISLAVAFKRSKDNQNMVRNPIETISVG
ncbi:MAG: potassium transporter KtrB [Clostridia bacterium]|nr:potassium transporter KtrB [Clostridia bacterium]MBQ7095786.1 potassium transporter KtrB [Clostridia bacterium]